jgi:hypothetical protein
MKSNPQSRIIFLTHESAAASLLAETLAGTVGISGIVVESRWDKYKYFAAHDWKEFRSVLTG